jgi:hypothetical protein
MEHFLTHSGLMQRFHLTRVEKKKRTDYFQEQRLKRSNVWTTADRNLKA